MFRLIENRKAKKPFIQETVGVRIFTLEELCFCMKQNLYLLDHTWICEALFDWLKKELNERELSESLKQIYQKTKDVYRCAEYIFVYSGLYTETELERMRNLFALMRGKNELECRKLRADLLLEEGKYRQAAYTYMQLLQPEQEEGMSEELRGDICHNLGVIYGRLFLFPEAAGMFAKSYALRKNEQTRQAYLFAMNYLKDSYPTDDTRMDLSFSVMRDAFRDFSRISDDPEFYVKRKEASQAAEAFDWKKRQTELIQSWKAEFRMINSLGKR